MTIHTSSKVHTSNVTSTSWSHVTAEGENEIYVLFACNGGSPTVTYNGVSLSQEGTDNTGGRYVYIFKLATPAVGTYDVAVGNFTTGYFIGWAITLPVNIGNPNNAFTSAKASSASPSVSVTFSAGVTTIGIMAGSGNAGPISITPGGSETTVVSSGNPSWMFGEGSYEVVDGTLSDALGGSAGWVMAAVGVNPPEPDNAQPVYF